MPGDEKDLGPKEKRFREAPKRVTITQRMIGDGMIGSGTIGGVSTTAPEHELKPKVLDQVANVQRAFPGVMPRPQESTPGKLAVIPFSVLLPQIGELAQLVKFHPALRERYLALVEARSTSAEEVSRESLAEEHLLSQVLQWLSVSGEELS